MAKTFYIPVNGQSKTPKKWYVPVNGLSKEAKKAYAPRNGIGKQFWPIEIPDYEEVYIDPSLDPSWLYIWEEPLYVHRGPFDVVITAPNWTRTDHVNIPSDGCVISNNLYKPDYIVEQLIVLFKQQPSVSAQSVYYNFDSSTYTVVKNGIQYWHWILQPRQYEWEDKIRPSVRTSAGASARGNDAIWEASYIIFGAT